MAERVALPKPVARLCNQIAADRAKPYIVATARETRQEAAKRLEAGLPLADLLRALQRDREAAAAIARTVDAETPGLDRLVLRPVVVRGGARG